MGSGWSPWRALREREHVTFRRVALPAGVGGGLFVRWPDGRAVVAVDEELGQAERRAVLAHELVHDERGALPAGAPAWLEAKEEAAVDAVVAERLVPSDELRAWAREAFELADAVEAWQVAERFGVPEAVARRAVVRALAAHLEERIDAVIDGWPPPEPDDA